MNAQDPRVETGSALPYNGREGAFGLPHGPMAMPVQVLEYEHGTLRLLRAYFEAVFEAVVIRK